jgi:hypothetical protein
MAVTIRYGGNEANVDGLDGATLGTVRRRAEAIDAPSGSKALVNGVERTSDEFCVRDGDEVEFVMAQGAKA